MSPDRADQTKSMHAARDVEHVLVGIDGSDGALAAVDWAVAAAARRHAGLRLLACYTLPPSGDPGVLGTFAIETQSEAIQQEYEEYIDRAVQHLRRGRPELPVERRVVLSSPASGLIEAAQDHDLIVVGAAGRSGAMIDAIGSVATAVAHRSPVPVVVVPTGRSNRSGPMKKIIVGVDGSKASEAALQWAYREAAMAHAELEVLHAWEYPYPTVEPDPTGPRHRMQQHALEELDRSTIALKHLGHRNGVKVQARLAEGSTAKVLLDASADADLVVVGSRGRGGFASLVLGSVSRTIVQHALCPVAVIHPEH